MTKLTKSKKAALEKIDRNKAYTLDEAVDLVRILPQQNLTPR